MAIDPWKKLRGYLCPVCNVTIARNQDYMEIRNRLGQETFYHRECYDTLVNTPAIAPCRKCGEMVYDDGNNITASIDPWYFEHKVCPGDAQQVRRIGPREFTAPLGEE